MITLISPPTREYYIDPRRPNLFCDADHDKWKKFHKIIKESPIEIQVNRAFNFIESCLENKENYDGGFFHYTFWFKSLEDQHKFINECNELYPGFIKPWMLPDYIIK